MKTEPCSEDYQCGWNRGVAKKRTPGRWIAASESVWAKDEEGEKVCDMLVGWNPDYIAACTGNAEAGWETTRAVLADIQGMLNFIGRVEKPGPLYEQAKIVSDALAESILAQWSLELLATAEV